MSDARPTDRATLPPAELASPATAPTRRRERRVFTVSRLMQDVQQKLEAGFGTLWLEGELSNVARPGSGHLYFTLKDSRAQIRCAMFKGRNRYVEFEPAAGDAVLVRGKLGLYAARGDFQLIVEHMEPAGAGRLQAAFEALKRELHGLGWFDQAGKRALPPAPDRIGVVTSPTGAALRDVLQVLARRFPQGRVVLYPTLTQGERAARDVARALGRAEARRDVDVLLLVRGGGSLEDLQAFNDRTVAAAIRACSIPLIAGVGHEVDVTIADLVADLRAPTPSAAAELATPDGQVLIERSAAATRALQVAVRRRLQSARREHAALETRLAARHPERLLLERDRHLEDLRARLHARTAALATGLRQRSDTLANRLAAQHPGRQVIRAAERLDGLQRRASSALERQTLQRRERLQRLERRLHARTPSGALATAAARRERLAMRLTTAMRRRLDAAGARLEPLGRSLSVIGPQAVLERGYALLERPGGLILRLDELQPGERFTARLADGRVHATADTLEPDVAHESEVSVAPVTNQDPFGRTE